jgi:FkbM family methyltransferase
MTQNRVVSGRGRAEKLTERSPETGRAHSQRRKPPRGKTMDAIPSQDLNRSRKMSTVVRSLLQRRQYGAAIETLKQCRSPVDFLSRYAMERGKYPFAVSLRTPTNSITLNLYSWHDSRTIHEIFFARDYSTDGSAKIIVDFGSNIGISAAYFLSRNLDAKIYLFEPVPINIERLHANLRQFAGRFILEEVAVGDNAGTVRFGVEPTGRYGGIGLQTGDYIDVVCKDSNHILQNIVDEHRRIDLLKIDVETMEERIVNNLDQGLASRIEVIIVEYIFDENPLKATHEMSSRGGVSRFKLKYGSKSGMQ